MNTKKRGNKGEDAAISYLKNKGYIILERNFRILRGEIDVIAVDKKTLVFVEVKSGSSSAFGPPETWVTPYKQRQLGRLASAFLQTREIVNIDCRFDVVAITFKNNRSKIHHIENAFWLR